MRFLVPVALSAACGLAVGLPAQTASSTWECSTLANESVVPAGAAVPGSGPHAQFPVRWSKLNCSGTIHSLPKQQLGPLIVNVAAADIGGRSGGVNHLVALPQIVIRPAVAHTTLGLAKLHELAATAAQDAPGFTPLAGVNGGYFFEVNRESFFDDVCFGKIRADAERNVSESDPNAGIGDCLTIAQGQYLSSNCDKVGNSKPVAAILDGFPRFVQMDRAQKLPATVQWAIAAGPNLVSHNSTTNQSYVNIVGDNVNIVERASNTALAVRGSDFMLVTFDGEDGCKPTDPTCGVNSHQFAHFLIDYLKADSAMEMDQGGSTAMWISGQPGTVPDEPGIVTNPGYSERQIFNGVFIGLQSTNFSSIV